MVIQISRSEQKRRFKEIEALIAALLTLPTQALLHAPVEDDFKEKLLEAARLEGSVRQRQVKHLTKLLPEDSIKLLYDLVGVYRGKALAAKKQLHTLEFYRDALINEALAQQQLCRQNNIEWEEDWDSETLKELQQHLPEIEKLTLSRLSHLFARTRNPRYSREIVRYLRSVEEMRQRSGR